MDALFFEEYYCYSHDYLNTGVGFSLISTYLTFPFLPTLITTYLLDRSPLVAWYYLVLIGIMNAVGYVIFRYRLELQTIIRVLAITEKDPTGAFSWLKVPQYHT